MGFDEYYYKEENGELKSVATYSSSVNTMGIGSFQEHGKEQVIWAVEDGHLYFKASNDKDDQLKTEDYRYDVYRIDEDRKGGRCIICIGKKSAFILR